MTGNLQNELAGQLNSSLFKQYALWQKQLFNAHTPAAARLVMVNDLQNLIQAAQIILLEQVQTRSPRVTAVSNLPSVDRSVPLLDWLEKVTASLAGLDQYQGVAVIKRADLPDLLRKDFRQLALPNMLWIPLQTPSAKDRSVLILARDTEWSLTEQHFFRQMAPVMAYRLNCQPRQWWVSVKQRLRPWKLAIASILILALIFVPVRLSVLAPGEIIADQPFLLTAPYDGVIKKVHVTAGQQVQQGALLAEMDDSEIINQRDLARQQRAVARAELDSSQQALFSKPAEKARLAELQAQLQLENIRYDYAQRRLEQTRLTAGHDGIVIVDNPQQWQAQPVRVGQQILKVANADQVQLKVMVPVTDAVSLQAGSEILLFLDTDPLKPLAAQLTYASYEPEVAASQTAAYPVYAALQSTPAPRIGLRGTAKIYGESVSLFYYLFRKPLTTLRQWLGW